MRFGLICCTSLLFLIISLTYLIFSAPDDIYAATQTASICTEVDVNTRLATTADNNTRHVTAILNYIESGNWQDLPLQRPPSPELVTHATNYINGHREMLAWLAAAHKLSEEGKIEAAADTIIKGISVDHTLLAYMIDDIDTVAFTLIPRLVQSGNIQTAQQLISACAIASADPIAYMHHLLKRMNDGDITAIWTNDPYIVLVDFSSDDDLYGMHVICDFQNRASLAWTVDAQSVYKGDNSVRVTAERSSRNGDLNVGWQAPFLRLATGASGIRVYARSELPAPVGIAIHAAGHLANGQPFYSVLRMPAPKALEDDWLSFDTSAAGRDLFGTLINEYGQSQPWSIWNMDIHLLEQAEMKLAAVGLDIPPGDANKFWMGRIELYIPAGSWNEVYQMPTPSGFGRGWHRIDQVHTKETATSEITQQLEALGYFDAISLAPANTGVITYNAEKAFPGLNFYTSGGLPEVYLADMEGQMLHVWRPRLDDPVWPTDIAEALKTLGWRRAHLYPDGHVLVVHCGLVMAKLDKDGRAVWVLPGGYHHDFKVMDDGTIYTLYREWEPLPNAGVGKKTLVDYIMVLDPDGREIKRVSLLQSLEDSHYAPMLRSLDYTGDILHTNSIQVLDGQLRDRIPAFKAGNVMVCMLKPSLIAIVDMDEQQVVWGLSGKWLFPHDPRLLPNNTMLLFDNKGPAWHPMTYMASRVMEFDPITGEVVWEYTGSRTQPFHSNIMGAASLLPNNNVLISETTRGRVFEVTRDKEIVWEYINPVLKGENNDMIAIIPELIRYPTEYTESWLHR